MNNALKKDAHRRRQKKKERDVHEGVVALADGDAADDVGRHGEAPFAQVFGHQIGAEAEPDGHGLGVRVRLQRVRYHGVQVAGAVVAEDAVRRHLPTQSKVIVPFRSFFRDIAFLAS